MELVKQGRAVSVLDLLPVQYQNVENPERFLRERFPESSFEFLVRGVVANGITFSYPIDREAFYMQLWVDTL